MPRVTRYQQQTGVSGVGEGIARPRPGNLAGIAAVGADAVERIRRREEAGEVARALSELRLKSAQRFSEAQGKAADDAADFTPGVLSQFDQDLEETKKAAKSKRAKEAITNAGIDIREDMGLRAMGFEANRKAAFRVSSAKDSIDKTRATLELDPDQYQSALAEQDMAINALELDPVQRQELRNYLATQGFEGAAIGVTKRDPALALKNLATTESGDARFDRLDATQRKKLEIFAKGQLAEVTANQIVEQYRTDARAGTKALTELAKSGLPPEIQNEVRNQVRTGVGLLHSERREEHGEQVTALERSITQGKPGANAEGQAAALYRRGAYSAEQYTNVLQAIDSARQKGAEKAAGIEATRLAIVNGQRLDPRDKEVVKNVDALFTDAMETAKVVPGSDEWVNSAAALANQTNILPPEAMSWARKTILSGEPKLAVPAAHAMTRWSEAAPAAYAFFDDPLLKANAESIDGMIRAGVAPARAVELARQQTYDIPKARLDALNAAWGKGKHAAANADTLGDLMDGDDAFEVGWRGVAPEAPLGMQDEFNAQVRRYFDLTNGDISRARELAWKDIRGTYGVSTVNGEPQVLKYAPELVFPGIDPKVIRSDIDAAAATAGIKTPVTLTPSRATGDTHGVLWNLSTVDEDGNAEVLLDEKNRPLVYAIPTDTGAYVKAQAEAKQKAVDEARATSKSIREQQQALGELGAFPGY